VAEQARLDVLHGQRFAEKCIALEVDLTDGEVVQGVPPPQVEAQVVLVVVGEVLGRRDLRGGAGHGVLPDVATTRPAFVDPATHFVVPDRRSQRPDTSSG
jgi:hypothetical protein